MPPEAAVNSFVVVASTPVNSLPSVTKRSRKGRDRVQTETVATSMLSVFKYRPQSRETLAVLAFELMAAMAIVTPLSIFKLN